MNQAEWQKIAKEKLHAAEVLLDAGEWASAYYLAGYAVECGLKSCIIARLVKAPHLIFEENQKKYSENCWTHNVGQLLDLAGLKEALDAANDTLTLHWMCVKEWNEQSRYKGKNENDARSLYNAITDATNGVMTWLRTYW